MDLNVRAFRTVQAALSEPVEPDKRKESSRRGGVRGGRSRASILSAQRRTEIARRASLARWKKRPPADEAAT
jgi:hypothetical protein